MAEITLTPNQQAAVSSRGGALLVSAAAGSGKTRVLVERLIKMVVEEKKDIDSFLIITFTNAAAAELRGKILEALSKQITQNPGDIRLHRQFSLCYNAKISTIHSFCSDVIKNNAHILGISPDIKVIDESENTVLKEKVLSDLLDDKYERIEEGSVFSVLVDTFSSGRSDKKLGELVLNVYEKMQMSIFPEKWAKEQKSLLFSEDITDLSQTVWGQELLDYARRSVSFWIEKMAAAIAENESEPSFFKAYYVSMSETLDALKALRVSLNGSWDSIVDKLYVPFNKVKPLKGFDQVKAVRKSCKEDMEKLSKLFSSRSQLLLDETRSVAPQMAELIDLATEFSSRYSAEKRRKGVIDFNDQEHLALKVLINENAEPTNEARAIASGFTEIMVDEYQDVNGVQEAIFNAVSKDGKNIFMVGDVKQSIYRFRLADPSIFIEKYKTLKPYSEAGDGEGRKIVLSSNFRSCAGVLAACNHIFKNVMSEELGEIEYTSDEYLYPGRNDTQNSTAEMELCILDMKDLDDEDDKPEKVQLEADAVAEKIWDMKHSVKLPDGGGGMRDARWEDFAILLRTMSGKAVYYLRSLQRKGIPTNCDMGDDFFKSNEVLSMMSLLTVIDNPRQDIPLISAMRSFLFGFTADELAKIRAGSKNCQFYDAVTASSEGDEKIRNFLETLNGFRSASSEMSADRLLWNIYMKTSAFAICGAMADGKARQNNLTALFELAQKYESEGYRGLFGFITYLRDGAESGKLNISVQRESEESGVQILSIHKSKGLEYPIVILADTAKKFNLKDSSAPLPIHGKLGFGPEITDLKRKIKYPSISRTAVSMRIRRETLSEELRVLYVALTRAREKLVVFASFSDGKKRLKKLSESLSSPIAPYQLEKCQSMGEWILSAALMRNECAESLLEDKGYICPGDGYTWKAGFIFPPECSKKVFGRYVSASNENEEIDISELRRRLEFVYPYASAQNIPSKLTATELKGRFLDAEADEEAGKTYTTAPLRLFLPDFSASEKPLTGAEKGTALHLALQLIDYGKCNTLEGIASELNRMREMRLLTEKQAASVDVQKIYRFFASDVGRSIISSKNSQREFKFSVLVDADRFFDAPVGDSILLQGVIDCFYEDSNGLHIVDYKTDYVNEKTLNDKLFYYKGQLETYAMALKEITGKEVSSKTLYFFHIDRGIHI